MQRNSFMYCTCIYCITLAEETTESKGGHFAKLKWFSIAKITILWRVLKFKKGHGPICPPISAAYAVLAEIFQYCTHTVWSVIPLTVTGVIVSLHISKKHETSPMQHSPFTVSAPVITDAVMPTETSESSATLISS